MNFGYFVEIKAITGNYAFFTYFPKHISLSKPDRYPTVRLWKPVIVDEVNYLIE
jgi:hypothetical protein